MSTPMPERSFRSLAGVVDAEDLAVEVSIVMPCLNEAETLEACIGKAKTGLSRIRDGCNISPDASLNSSSSRFVPTRIGDTVSRTDVESVP